MKLLAYYNEIDTFCCDWLSNLMDVGVITPGYIDNRSIEDVTPDDVSGYTRVGFFAGIGVWDYALRLAGWPEDRPVWHGSCPCQPFSSAGKGMGFKDERHLWPEFYRLISQCRPTVCFGEQVASKDGLAWLDLVQADMENADYAFGAVDTCAAGFGAPHIRQRLYWVGSDTLGNAALRGCIRGEVGNEAGPQCTALGSRKNERCGRHDTANDGACLRLPHAHDTRSQGRCGVCQCTPKCTAGQNKLVGRMGDTSGIASERDAGGVLAQKARVDSEGRVDGGIAVGLEHASSGVGGVADAEGGGRREKQQDDGRRDAGTGEGKTLLLAGDSSHHRSRPTNGFWADADWLLCRDGKWRATQSLVIEMADGLADRLGYSRFGDRWSLNPLIQKAENRVGRLKGYGNAINAEQAKSFIEAFMETTKEHQPCLNN